MKIEIPDTHRRKITETFGEAGEQWLQDFPRLLEEVCRAWQVDLGERIDSGYPTNFIFEARRKNEDVVLKIGHPHDEQVTEMHALDRFKGRHCVRLLEHSEAFGAILLPHIRPGTPLRISKGNRTRSVATLIANFPLPLADSVAEVPGYGDWLQKAFAVYRAGQHPDDEYLEWIGEVEHHFDSLVANDPGGYLLHGDLHHENILRDETGGWTVIDPKGVIGPRVMEAGRFMHNFPDTELDELGSLPRVFETRADDLAAAFDVDRFTILKAGFIDLVLACCWVLNDGNTVDLDLIRAMRATL